MNRTITALFIVFIIQAGLIAYVYMPKEKNDQHLFFAKQKDASITSVTITDKKGKTLVLQQKDSHWLVRQDGQLIPADEKKVTGQIQKLKNLAADRLTTRTAGSHARLEVADTLFQRKMEITFDSNISRTLFLGSSPSFQTVHARADKEKNVYLVRGMSPWDMSTDARSWWKEKYLAFETDTVRSFSLTRGKRSIFGKKDKDTWQISDNNAGPYKEADSQKITSLLNDMALKVTDYLGTKQKTNYGLDAPSATISLSVVEEKTGSETTLACTIGLKSVGKSTAGKEPPKQYVAKATGSDWYIALKEDSVKKLLETKIETLLVKKENKASEQKKEDQ